VPRPVRSYNLSFSGVPQPVRSYKCLGNTRENLNYVFLLVEEYQTNLYCDLIGGQTPEKLKL
jgi:hypothetical protein